MPLMHGPPRRLRAFGAFLASVGLVANAWNDEERDWELDRDCNKWYPKPVETYCHKNFPNTTGNKLWLMLFSSHDCYHCKTVEKNFVKLAKDLEDNPSVGVGAVNCYYAKNYKILCDRGYKVDALPSLRVIDDGKFKTNLGRHTWGQIMNMVDPKLKERPACPEGSFAAKTSAVVPLCSKRFPLASTPQPWLMLFYSKEALGAPKFKDFVSSANSVAHHLGNNPNYDGGTEWSKMKKRDRLLAIKDKYKVKLSLPGNGPFGFDGLVKVGAVCCDCDADEQAFCDGLTQAGTLATLPAAAWVEGGETLGALPLAGSGFGAALVGLALERIGFLEGSDHSEL